MLTVLPSLVWTLQPLALVLPPLAPLAQVAVSAYMT